MKVTWTEDGIEWRDADTLWEDLQEEGWIEGPLTPIDAGVVLWCRADSPCGNCGSSNIVGRGFFKPGKSGHFEFDGVSHEYRAFAVCGSCGWATEF